SIAAPISISRVPAPRPKRRNIFLRLFSPQQSPRNESGATLHHNGNGTSKSTATDSFTAETSAVNNPLAPHDGTETANIEPEAAPIAASELPSAVQALAELFPSEAAQMEVAESVSGDSVGLLDASDIEAALESLSPSEPAPIEASTDVVIPSTTELIEPSASVAADSEAIASKPPDENLQAEPPEEKSIAQDEDRPDKLLSPAESSTEDLHAQVASGPVQDNPAEKFDEENTPQSEEKAAESSEGSARRRPYKNWAFDDKLASHKEWIDSRGLSGKRADLAGADLEAADLISVNLRLADLHDANLRAADLLLADLRDACLVRADLEDACLVGANLEAANLEGASLETAMGLVPRQIAGANLR